LIKRDIAHCDDEHIKNLFVLWRKHNSDWQAVRSGLGGEKNFSAVAFLFQEGSVKGVSSSIEENEQWSGIQ